MGRRPINCMTHSESSARARASLALLPEPVRKAIQIAQSKRASDVVVLDLRRSDAFTDFFVICSAQTTRQAQAIVNAIEELLLQSRLKPSHVEGSKRAEWLLMDFFDFVVHVFTPETRLFYALERLWGNAERIEVPQED